MDIVAAVKGIKEGKKVRREVWPDKKSNIMISGGYVAIKNEDGLYHPWIIGEADIYAQDWEISFDA